MISNINSNHHQSFIYLKSESQIKIDKENNTTEPIAHLIRFFISHRHPEYNTKHGHTINCNPGTTVQIQSNTRIFLFIFFVLNQPNLGERRYIKSTQNKSSMCFGSFYRKVPPRLYLILFWWRRFSTPGDSSREF